MAVTICSFVCRLKRVLVGHWSTWPSSASSRNTAGCPRCFVSREILDPMKFIIAAGGGLCMAPINAPLVDLAGLHVQC